MSGENLLVLNPGGGSTKAAFFRGDEKIWEETIRHDPADLAMFSRSVDQQKYRLYGIAEVLHRRGLLVESLDACVGRGGPLGPLPAGTYRVCGDMVQDILKGRVQTDHPSLLGGLLARKLTAAREKPAFVVDPVSVDELADEARLSGLCDCPRRSLWHALNSRYVARLACERRGFAYEKARLVVAHMGTGISVSAHIDGRSRDVNNANEGGPFSPQRAGGLPTEALVSLCFADGADEKKIRERLTKRGGLADHLGTMDLEEVEARMDEGDAQAELVWRTMAYQTAKEIGSMAAVCMGRPDLLVLTGGLAHSERFVREIRERVDTFAPVEVFPGEMEMEALAAGALRVLRGREKALHYGEVRQHDKEENG